MDHEISKLVVFFRPIAPLATLTRQLIRSIWRNLDVWGAGGILPTASLSKDITALKIGRSRAMSYKRYASLSSGIWWTDRLVTWYVRSSTARAWSPPVTERVGATRTWHRLNGAALDTVRVIGATIIGMFAVISIARGRSDANSIVVPVSYFSMSGESNVIFDERRRAYAITGATATAIQSRLYSERYHSSDEKWKTHIAIWCLA